MKRFAAWCCVLAAAALLGGCKEKEANHAGSSTSPPPRQIGQFSDTGQGSSSTTQPGAMGMTTTRPGGMGMATTRPSGNMPNDAIHAKLRGQVGDDVNPRFTPPADWQPKPPRPMTEEVYALPRAEGDPEDADLAVSYVSLVPMEMNVNRWCSQFGLKGDACKQAAKEKKLEGTKFPTTIVSISGTFQPSGGPMMQAAGPAKPNFRMLAAEIRAPQRAWIVKMIGPEKTVAKWENAFNKFVADAAK